MGRALDAMARRWGVLPSEILKCSPEEMAVNFFVLDAAMAREADQMRKLDPKGVMPVIVMGDYS